MLYRTGPGGHQIDTEKNTTFSVSHWFDGLSQVHRFALTPSADGTHVSEVTYNSRHTCDELVQKVRKTGELGKLSFGQKYDPCQSFFKKVMSTFQAATAEKPSDPEDCNVGVTLQANMPYPGKMPKGSVKPKANDIDTFWAKTDTASMQQLDPTSLQPLTLTFQERMHPLLKGPFAAAHSRSDPVTGDWYNFNLELGRNSTYRVFRVSGATGQVDILATLKGDDIKPAYIHSFMMTERYLLFCIYSSHLSMGGMAVLWVKNLLEAMEFDSDSKNIWFVIDRIGDKGIVGIYESEAFFAFHPVNAWEQPSETDPKKVDIVTDVPTFPDISVLKRFYYENMKGSSPDALNYVGEHRSQGRGSLTRFKLSSVGDRSISIDSARGRVETVFKAKSDDSMELPTFNPKLTGKPSRYIWGVCDRGNSTFIDGLIKFDSRDQTSKAWIVHGQSPGEPIFIPDPEGKDEDDGVNLSVVLDGTKGKSYLLVLDAKTFTEVGRAEMESAVGFGFHGSHISL